MEEKPDDYILAPQMIEWIREVDQVAAVAWAHTVTAGADVRETSDCDADDVLRMRVAVAQRIVRLCSNKGDAGSSPASDANAQEGNQ